MKTARILMWLPLLGFLLVLGLVAGGLIHPHDSTIHSQMVDKPLPVFSLPRAGGGAPLTTASFADGTPRVVNLFASWCVPCAAEAPQLMALKQAGVPIVGIAVRDKPEDLAGFLQQYGNPYQAIGRDDASALQVALGSSGVPESFVIDGKGTIRLQHIGDIRPEQVSEMIAAVRDAR